MRYDVKRGFVGALDDTRISFDKQETRFQAVSSSDDAAYWVDFRLEIRQEDSYIMIPACAYDGNRFEAVERQYPPMFLESEMGVDVPVRMTQVPRLSRTGDSFMDVTTGDMAMPCVCVLDKTRGEGFMLFTNQGDHGLNHGVSLEQTSDALTIRLRAPAKRRLVYRWYDGVPSLRENPSADAPLKVAAGTETIIPHRVLTFPCRDIPALFEAFFKKRHELFNAGEPANLPFSAFWEMAREQHDAEHFEEKEGLYTLQSRERWTSRFSQWQSGWVGGGMISLPMLCEGTALSRERAISTLRFAGRYQSKAGWFYAMVFEGKIYHDCFQHYEGKYNMLLVRKHADLTHFMFRHLIALKHMRMEAPEDIQQSAVRAADALVGLWKRYGQMGQFINAETGEIVVGGSTSGAITPAALCAAAAWTGDERYAACAREIGDFFYRTATLQGVTTGGPGEILQAPDSESAGALLESFIALYEMDKTEHWLTCARDAAHQLASWVVPYDYAFPPESRFARMGILSAGSVWANAQNKHSAPGLCTASPVALFKLYRATGNEKYLELMRRIARFMPQVASYPERPMMTVMDTALKPAEMCERVNLSDWEGTHNVGDAIGGNSVWPEVALMLTWLEVPGVYAAPERGLVCASDHVEARLEEGTLVIHNPTAFPAKVKVMIESEEDMKRPLGLWWQDAFTRVGVPAGETARVPMI